LFVDAKVNKVLAFTPARPLQITPGGVEGSARGLNFTTKPINRSEYTKFYHGKGSVARTKGRV
jgi:hypothetical protein